MFKQTINDVFSSAIVVGFWNAFKYLILFIPMVEVNESNANYLAKTFLFPCVLSINICGVILFLLLATLLSFALSLYAVPKAVISKILHYF